MPFNAKGPFPLSFKGKGATRGRITDRLSEVFGYLLNKPGVLSPVVYHPGRDG